MDDYIPSFLKCTPFGAYCGDCNKSLSLYRGILCHAKESHPGNPAFNNSAVVRLIKDEMKKLRNIHSNDFSPFLKIDSKPQEMWFCTVCLLVFGNKTSNYQRHMQLRKGICSGGKMPLFPTICCRWGPISLSTCTPEYPPSVITAGSTIVSSLTLTNSSLSTSTKNLSSHLTCNHKVISLEVPAQLMFSHDEAVHILSPFVRDDEDPSELSLIYCPLLGPSFEGMMREYLSYYSRLRQAENHPVLSSWIQAGALWLKDYAAGHIANVSANVRNRLAEFEQKELEGGVTIGTRTFTLRRGKARLISELESALRFFYFFPTTLFDEFKSIDPVNCDLKWMIKHAIIPRILYMAACEKSTSHGDLPVACRYCLSRGFTEKTGGRLIMNECGWFSSRISAMMHLLRAGVCGYLVTLAVQDSVTSSCLSSQEMEIVRSIQHGRVTNLLAPYVKRLRDMNARKPPVKNNTVNGNGDITCGAFTFVKTVWSTLIPRVIAMCKILFAEIFVGGDWEFLLTKPVMVSDWKQLHAYVQDGDRQIFLDHLPVRALTDGNRSVFARIQSIAELCLFGLGVGAVRFEEVSRLTTTSCQWHNSFMYFWSESMKQGALMRGKSKPKLVEHRLSLSLSRVFLLIRRSLQELPRLSSSSLLPSITDASMLSVVQDIFDLDFQPQMLHVRHLFTSIGNILMPDHQTSMMGAGQQGHMVSSLLLTEKSGHTQATGRRAYSTILENSEEALYDHYHKELGETCLEPPPIEFVPFPGPILKASLRELVGKRATFRNAQQREMVKISSNMYLRHAFAGLPCGHGKSMAWMVPIVASFLTGRDVGLRIVVLPYKFLLGHLVERAKSQLGVLHDRLSVEFLESSDIAEDTVPRILVSNSRDVPALLFLNLDGAVKLMRYHMDFLQKLASENILKRIYVDEFQQLIVEFGFRSPYQGLRELGRIGAPVLCLSGSLPSAMAMHLMSYCRLKIGTQPDSVEIIEGLDPIGDGFTFDIHVVEDIVESIVAYVCQSPSRVPCHIICSSKVTVENIASSSRLSPRYRVAKVTGDTASSEQFSISKCWSNGEIDILVSTSVALVGNENGKCKTVVIAGFLYNVSSLVQAFGRLRPEQRGSDATVCIFRSPFRKNERSDARTIEKNAFEQLRTTSCLGEDVHEMYCKIFSPCGLQDIFCLKGGCYLKALSSYFGYDRTACGRCTLCKGDLQQADNALVVHNPYKRNVDGRGESRDLTPVMTKRMKDSTGSLGDGNIGGATKQLSPRPVTVVGGSIPLRPANDSINEVRTIQAIANSMGMAERKIRAAAQCVLAELRYRCVSCGYATCAGDMCLRGCYRCGDQHHMANVCAYTMPKLSSILANKGVCFGCFDTTQRAGMKTHDIRECPLKRRLKRLVFLDRARKSKTFDAYLRCVYADELSFLTMVSTYSNKVTLGGYVVSIE
jgi:superfamily II DNA helicase RecQ